MKIKYPKNLEKQDTIGVTATSSGVIKDVDIKKLNNAYKNLNKMGYKIIETKNVRQNKQFVSSDSKTRANEFLELWKDKNIDVIAQVRGGEFLMEILPYIDKDIILNNKPKWIFGYSDSSLLNFYLTTNYYIATSTGMNIMKFGMEPLDNSLLMELKVLEKNEYLQENFLKYEEEKTIKETYNTPFNLTKNVYYKNLYKNKKTLYLED